MFARLATVLVVAALAFACVAALHMDFAPSVELVPMPDPLRTPA